jgi:radical SAM protein with 4Fe4S-binding SPASM domain
MEFNLAQSVLKFVRSQLQDVSAFDSGSDNCCDMRCGAGRQLMYFDQKGQAYPCPRANVTANARIGHYADDEFGRRWDETIRDLDASMAIPAECRLCPAQLVCDYGCHAFNVARGNFFEVNCDATKDYFRWVEARLDDVARIFLYNVWREQLKAVDAYEALQGGVDLPSDRVGDLAAELRRRLARRLSGPDIVPEVLTRRYGWRDDRVPDPGVEPGWPARKPASVESASRGGGS